MSRKKPNPAEVAARERVARANVAFERCWSRAIRAFHALEHAKLLHRRACRALNKLLWDGVPAEKESGDS